MSKHINNTFFKGLNWDYHPHKSDNQSLKFAKGIILNDNEQNIFPSNEHGNRLLHEYNAEIVGKRYISKWNSELILLNNGEIHLFDYNTETNKFVASDSEIGCDWGFHDCEFIDVHVYEQYICDTWITYSSGKVYYNINLSELLDPVRKQGLIKSLSENCGTGCSQKTCEYFRVFKKSCDPHIEAIELNGGNLRNGTYFIGGRYKNQDGAYSNPFILSKAIHISGENNIAGEEVNKRIEITIQNTSCMFNMIEIFVHQIIGGKTSTVSLNPTQISGDSFTVQYTGNEGLTIDSAELFINSRTYIEGEDLYLFNNRAIYYRTTPEFEYNFQGVANQIETYYYAVKVPFSDIKKYNLKTLLRGETYAVSFSPNYKYGKKGYGFHIGAINGSGNCSNTIQSGKSLFKPNINNIVNSDKPSESLTKPKSIIKIPNITNAPSSSDTEIKESGSSSDNSSFSTNYSSGILYKRIREDFPSTVNNPTETNIVNRAEAVVDEWVTQMDDICKAIEAGCFDLSMDSENPCDCGDLVDAVCEQERRKQLADICRQDHLKAEQIAATWLAATSDYIDETSITGVIPGTSLSDNQEIGSSPANILHNPVSLFNSLKEASQKILDKVKKRERFKIEYNPHKFTKTVTYTNDALSENDNYKQKFNQVLDSISSTYGITNSFNFFAEGSTPPSKEVEIINNIQIEVQQGIYLKYPIIKIDKTIPKKESIIYPCTTDCYGNPIYCDLAGQQITHHQIPFNDVIPMCELKSGGSGSTYQTDSDIMNGYGILIGLMFKNINIPSDVQDKLCPTNPYNIGIVKRDSSNSSIILKGIGKETFISSNQEGQYIHGNIGGNSFERCAYTIDINGSRMDPGASGTNSFLIYSLDQLVKQPFLNGTHLIREGTFRGYGARHFTYVRGEQPTDNRANRYDQRGSVHTLCVNDFTTSNTKVDLLSQIYADANTVVSPPAGINLPLMGKYRQSSLWVSANGLRRSIKDTSFVGDVLQQQAPADLEMDYFTVFRELDNQYGDLSSLNYVPVIQARGFETSVKGLIGDAYIGPYTFVDTHYVSDKVGNYFPVGNMVSGKSDRCICDSPEDAIHSEMGNWYWKTEPIDGDAADAKNWAGLHTTTTSKTWIEAQGVKTTESHYYFPRTTKHGISIVCETDTNPWLREKSDLLENQWFPEINPKYVYHTKATGYWKFGFLNQFYQLFTIPPAIKLQLKSGIKKAINILLPLLAIEDWTSLEGGVHFSGDMVSAVMQIAMWVLISQVLATNDFIDKWLGLESCKKDEDGGEIENIERWFENYNKYNYDYSIDYAFPTIKGIPIEYTGCYCTDDTTNNLYISEENDVTYYTNNYQIVKPLSYINLDTQYGKLMRIYHIGSKLFLHTSDGIYQSNIGSIQIPTNSIDLLMGSPNMISKPQLITNSSPEGDFGLDHPNHGKLTSLGFIFVDYNSKNLIIFTGSSFEVLSGVDKRMNKFFKEYLSFCTNNACIFEQVEGTNYYTIGVDYKYNRILFTKADGKYSYTISYDFLKKVWVSFHDYIPQEYTYDRNDLYTLYNNGIWKHDNLKEFNTYYNKYYGCRIDFVSELNEQDSIPNDNSFIYESTSIHTEAKDGNIRNFDVTFNTVNISNSFQSTGDLNLNLVKDGNVNIKDNTDTIDLTKIENSTFRFNEINDYLPDNNKIINIKDRCLPEPILNSVVDYQNKSKQTYKDNVFLDNHLYYSFIFNKFANIKLYIKNIITRIDKKPI